MISFEPSADTHSTCMTFLSDYEIGPAFFARCVRNYLHIIHGSFVVGGVTKRILIMFREPV